MTLWKKSGTLLIATGILHNVVGFIMGWDVLVAIAKAGFINSVGEQMDRNAIFWFLFSGFMIMLLGKFMQTWIDTYKKPVPAYLSYYLLLLSSIGCIFMPISGFWLVLPQAFIIIQANRKAAVLVAS